MKDSIADVCLKYGRVVSAALLHDNSIYISSKGHYDIFTMEPLGILRTATQGFVTENGYFVNRELGLYIASYFDQIENKHSPKDRLLSEDLKKSNLKILKRLNNYKYKEKE